VRQGREPTDHGQIAHSDENFTTAGLVAAMGLMTAPAAGAHASGNPKAFAVVSGHLNNPRGLVPAPGGGLFLAEAGSGGDICVADGPQGETCLGLTGSFDRVSTSGVTRIEVGLPGPTAGSPFEDTADIHDHLAQL